MSKDSFGEGFVGTTRHPGIKVMLAEAWEWVKAGGESDLTRPTPTKTVGERLENCTKHQR